MGGAVSAAENLVTVVAARKTRPPIAWVTILRHVPDGVRAGRHCCDADEQPRHPVTISKCFS
jgi:hypothetical protein